MINNNKITQDYALSGLSPSWLTFAIGSFAERKRQLPNK